MIFVTGDTHIPHDISKLNSRRFPQQMLLSKNDYVIVCGDFGGVWYGEEKDAHWLNWLNNKSFTTLFADGNHCNFDLLNAMPVKKWNGGNVHQIRESVYHLMRGQVFTIDGNKIFTMGGASSHDKEYRVEGRSWWSQELPSDKEYETAFKSLDENNWEVDFVITHCAPDRIQNILSDGYYVHDKLTNFLEVIDKKLKYKHWYFGHYHENGEIDNKHTVLFDDIQQIA